MASKKDKGSDAGQADEPQLGLTGGAVKSDGAYRVLARKYRPQTFEDAFIGQAAMVRTLGNAFAAGRIAHAFMLTGVRGVGKTTTARIIAKALNCIGPDGKRTLPVEELFAGYYETVLARNELIAELRIPPQGSRRAAYVKVTTGSADDWPALGVAVVIDGDRGAIKSARVVASAATSKATRMKSAEAVLNGKTVDDKVLKEAGEAAAAEAEYIADVRGSVPYKRELMKVYIGRAVRAAMQANGAH